jgi:sarcosine oxidase subunit beta
MTIDQDTGALWRPEVGGAAMAWALPEEPGEPLEHVPADWTFPAIVLEGVSRLVPFWSKVAETLTREQVFVSAGQYTCTPDHKPIIGPCGEVPGLFVNVGYSGHGVMASPGGARRLVDLVIDPTSDAQNPFCWDRFAKEGVGVCAESLVL